MSRSGSNAYQNRPFSSGRSQSSTSTRAAMDRQQYPEVKQRGFYSDIIGADAGKSSLKDHLVGPQTQQNTLWVVAKEEHTPSVELFQPPSVENLQSQIKKQTFGSSTEMTAVSDFPIKASEPKVQLPFFAKPGDCPRKIEIERRRRQYCRKDLKQLLLSHNIKTNALMPKDTGSDTVLLNADPDNPAPFPPYLPLHIFDNEEKDCRTPNEWVAMGQTNGTRKPVPGISLLPVISKDKMKDPTDLSITYDWCDVGVLDYDSLTKQYLVQKTNENGRVVDEEGQPIVNGGVRPDGTRVKASGQFWVPRIRLMFRAEDPRIFAERVAEAFESRHVFEAELRYNLYVDCMPMDGVGELDQASLRRMVEWARTTPGIDLQKNNLDDHLQVLEREVNIDFCRSMNRIIFDKTVKDDRKTFAFVTIPETPIKAIPEKGCCMDVPEYPFDEQYDNFAFNSLLTLQESIQAMGKVRTECNRVSHNMSLYHIPTAKPMRLEEFEQTQSQATSQTSMYLKDSWISSLRVSIRTCLRDVGKGWFNIHEKNWEVYEISKLKKFMETVKFIMQDSLRFLVQDSLVSFTQMVVDACHTTMSLSEDYTWGPEIAVSFFKPKKNALFLVDLVLDASGVHYSTSLPSFETTLISLFDRGILSTHNVPQLEKFIMEDIFWSGTPLLESVGEHEPAVEELRETVCRTIQKSLIPLKAYAREYERYLELMNLDINQYVKDYENQEHAAAEVKKEVEMHLEEKEKLEATIPSSIVIGPFWVSTENTRQALAKKRKALSNAVLELLARQLRKQADDACEEFKNISRKLYEKPNCVEELSEMREWMKIIPDKLKEHQELIDKAMQDYELIEEFYYNLSTDDFNAKWTAVGWPHKIERQMEQTHIQLNDDEERFHKLQLSDQSSFEDRLDTLQMVVAGMAAHTDITKATEIANEMRRVNKQLRDAQGLAVTYNNRERLFGMPVTNVSTFYRRILIQF